LHAALPISHEQLPASDLVALAHEQLSDHTAVRALHDLHSPARNDLARRASDLIDLGPARPGYESDQCEHRHADDETAPRLVTLRFAMCAHAPPPTAAATGAADGGLIRLRSSLTTCAVGPSITILPCATTMTRCAMRSRDILCVTSTIVPSFAALRSIAASTRCSLS